MTKELLIKALEDICNILIEEYTNKQNLYIMKLKPLKIGQLTITPKMLLSLIGALFIQGMGIGATVASTNNSKLALLVCTIISIIIVFYTFSKKRKN